MAIINLRKYYPWYTRDELVEVPDAVAETLVKCNRLEAAERRRVFYHRAHYSLDAGDGIETTACYLNMTPHEIFEHELLRCHVCQALNSLPEVQGRRIDAHFLHGISKSEIARVEGVPESTVRYSIKQGLEAMKISLEKF